MPTNARNNRRVGALLYRRFDLSNPDQTKFYNYDFHANWDKITALLQGPEAQPYIKRCWQLAFDDIKDVRFQYHHGGDKLIGNKAYKPTRDATDLNLNIDNYQMLPSFSSTDFHCMFMEFIKDLLLHTPLNELKISDETKTLILKYHRIHDNLILDENGQYSEDDYELLEELESEIMKTAGYHYSTRPYFIGFQVTSHMCHFFNPTIGLYLAKKLMPEENWQVFHTNDHTTVVSLTSNRVFDAIAWIWGHDNPQEDINRLYDVVRYELLGTEMPKLEDDTLGGISAIAMCVTSQ
jgi:hypothetical protein